MEVSALDNEHPNSGPLVIDRDAQINLTISNPSDQDDVEIDLFQVFANMRKSAVFYLWLMVLFIAIGLFIAAGIYYLTKPPLTVSSAVTLNYIVPDKENKGQNKQVDDLTAPDGEPLDLNQLLSSYVLQNALSDLELSVPVSVENLRSNITIERVPTESSNQQMELISKMIADKNSELYKQLQEFDFTYSNRFIVSLRNGFGQNDSTRKVYLKDSELSIVLNSVVSAYNSYLVRTYADVKLPNNPLALVTAGGIDNLQQINTLNTSLDELYAYCSEKPEEVRAYRSYRTGLSLNDLMNAIRLVQYSSTDYTESMIQSEALVSNINDTKAYYQFTRQDSEQKITALDETIQAINDTIANYHNEDIILTVQGSEARNTGRINTPAYNELFTNQVKNFDTLEALQHTNRLAQAKLSMLEGKTGGAVTEEVTAEIQSAIGHAQQIYNEINAHMQDLFESPFFTTFLEHSDAFGKPVSFLSANGKRLLIGGGVGFAFALMFWFIHALRKDIEATKRRLAEKEALRR